MTDPTLYSAVVWRETTSDPLQYGQGDSRKLQWNFFGVYTKQQVGSQAPQTSLAAVQAAETDGANLRIDGEFVPPGSLSGPPGLWVLSEMTVDRAPGTNGKSDILWVFSCTLEYSELASTTEPFVQVTQNAATANVSAWRISPTIPTDDFTSINTNDAVWHGATDIGGKKVDWSGQPIQYALPIHNASMTIYRPAPVWDDQGNRDLGAISVVSQDSVHIGKRNTEALGIFGDEGYAMLTGVSATPSGNGLYAITYAFRYHPFKHALQVPYMVGSTFKKAVNTNNATRLNNDIVWWSQPHLIGADFENVLQISTEEWEAVGVT